MTKRFYLTMLALLLAFSGLFAQNPQVKIGNVTSGPGEILVPLEMLNFTQNVNSFTFKITANSTLLQFVELTNKTGFTGPNYQAFQNGNTLTVVYFDIGSGYQPNGKIFDMKFNYSASASTTLAFQATGNEVTAGITEIPNITYTHGLITTTQPIPNPVVKLGDVTVAPGAVNVPVDMLNFTQNINSFTFKINVPSNLAQYVQLSNVVPGVSAGTFEAFHTGNLLTVVWFTPGGGFTPSGKVFDLSFNYVGGFNTDLLWSTGNEVTYGPNPVANVSYIKGSISQVAAAGTVKIGSASAVTGTAVSLPVNFSGAGFGNVAAFTLFTNFDASKLIYTGTSNAFSPDIVVNRVGNNISLAWQGSAQNFTNTDIIKLNFIYNGIAPAQLNFLPGCEVNNSNATLLATSYVNGTVSPAASTATLKLSDVTGLPGQTLTVPMLATDIGTIGALDLIVNFDNTKVTLASYNTPQLTGWVVNQTANQISFQWQNIAGATVANGALINLNFIYLGGGIAPISFGNGSAVTGTNALPVNVNFANGSITQGVSNMQASIGNITNCDMNTAIVPVTLTDVGPVTSFSFPIGFTSSVLTFVELRNVNPLLVGIQVNQVGNAVNIAWNNTTAINLNGKLFDLVFNYAGSTSPVNFNSGAEITGNGAAVLPVAFINGSVNCNIDTRVLTLNKVGSGSLVVLDGTTVLQPDNGTTNVFTVFYGKVLTLQATGDLGWEFANWQGPVNNLNTPVTTINMVSNATVTGTFSMINYTLSLAAAPVAGGTVSGGGTYNFGNSVTVTAVPNTGYAFVNWTEGTTVLSTNAAYTFSMPAANKTYTANFALINYTLTLAAAPIAGGTVSGGGTFNFGNSVTVTAVPNTGYAFVNWTEGTTVLSTNAAYTFSMPAANKTYTANFALINYTLTLAAAPVAGGTVSGGGTYNFGNSVTVTAVANAAYNFVNWTDGTTVLSTNAAYTFTMPASNKTYTANFVLKQYTVTIAVTPTGSGTVTGAGTYNHGASVTVNATANAGFGFVNWKNDVGTVLATTPQYVFTITSNTALTATFIANTPIIAVTPTSVTNTLVSGLSGTKPLTIANSGNAALNYSVAVNYLTTNTASGSPEIVNSQSISNLPTVVEKDVAGGIPQVYPKGTKDLIGDGTRAILHNNGPFINSPGAGPGGSDLSVLQGSLGMTTLGSSFNQAGGFRLADDFVVTAPWNVETFTFYGYQTFTVASTVSTMTGGYVQIWNGDPTLPASQIVWGNMTTNRMTSTAWTNVYRVSETTLTNVLRPVMRITCATPGLVLQPGTYWVEYGVTGSTASGPWAVPITINGQAVTGNAKQFNAATPGWVNFIDGGTSQAAQGLPFLVEGTLGSVAPTWLSVAPTSGSVAPGTSAPLTVSFNATGLAPGTYNANIVITSNATANPTVTVPVSLVVEAPCFPVPRSLTAAVTAQSVQLNWLAPILSGGGGTTQEFFEGFEAGTIPTGWVRYNLDTDTYQWENTATNYSTFTPKTGLYCMTSASYINGVGPLTPNNWLVTPPIKVSATSELKFWVAGQDAAYAAEKYYVKISTTGNAVANFTTTLHTAVSTATWTEVVKSLSAYAGQTIYIAFQHADVTDMFFLKLDDVKVTNTLTTAAYTPAIVANPSEVVPFKTAGMSQAQIEAKLYPPVNFTNGPSREVAENGGTAQPYQQGMKFLEGDGTRVVLHNNGPFINSPGAGPGGSDLSVLQGSLGMTTLGSSFNQAGGFRLADDFVVNAPWNVESFTFYGYQTFTVASTVSTMTGGYLQIWNGDPTLPASQIVWGNMTTNRMTSTAWTNVYRVSETTLTNVLRPVMRITCATPGLVLQPGTYWVEYGVTGSTASGPWAVPITINGQAVTGNAKQFNAATPGWVNFIDGGTSQAAQGLPFLVEGTVATPPCTHGVLTGYKVFRGTTQIGTTAANVVTYTDNNVPAGTYVYGVKAVYGAPHPGDSDAITVNATVTAPVISVTPTSLSHTLPWNMTGTKPLTIANTGSGALNYTVAINYLTSNGSGGNSGTIGKNPVDFVLPSGSDRSNETASSTVATPIVPAVNNEIMRSSFTQGFDDITTLPAAGWALINKSSPVGTSSWFQASATPPFPAHSGPATSYIGVNYNSTSGTGTISNWMLTPVIMLTNGHSFSFWTRTTTPGTTVYPDRLEVRRSLAGASQNVGTLATDVGDFTTLLLSVNPTLTTTGYPSVWTQYTVTITGLTAPTSGRLAFRYFVTSGGPTGANSDYIGIDTFVYNGSTVPSNWLTVTPASGSVAGGGSAPLTATFNATGLAIGTYTANVVITSNATVPTVTIPVTFIVTQHVGFDENPMSAIKVYPVPASHQLNVNLVEGVKLIRMFNYVGQMVLETNINGEMTKTLNLDGMRSGAYTLQFINAEGKNYNRTIVITK